MMMEGVDVQYSRGMEMRERKRWEGTWWIRDEMGRKGKKRIDRIGEGRMSRENWKGREEENG